MTAWIKERGRQSPHSSNTTIQFAEDAAAIGDETAYREVRALTSWCQDSNLHLHLSKTKEQIVDYRKRKGEKLIMSACVGTGLLFSLCSILITEFQIAYFLLLIHNAAALTKSKLLHAV